MISFLSAWIFSYKSFDNTMSDAPTVKPFCNNHWLTTLWLVVINSFVASGPIYNHVEWTSPPAPEPMIYFWRAPDSNCPFRMIIFVSLIFRKALSWSLYFKISIVILSGIIKLINCFPVQRGSGFKIAGWGSCPGNS